MQCTTAPRVTMRVARWQMLWWAILALLPCAARADLIGDINAIRTRGCESTQGAKTPLRRNDALDAVAREWSRGGRLAQALQRTEYRATNSTSMRLSGSRNDASLAAALRKNYCEEIAEREFQEIGMFRRGDSVWIVLAAPFVTPASADAPAIRRKVLELVNAARMKPRNCGSKSFSAVKALTGSAALDQAGAAHANDMAKHNWFEHQGTDGSTPAQRVERQGYRWRAVGENIAAGAATAEEVVKGWLDSPGHCSNIMSPQFTQMGVGYVVNPRSKSGIYWSQVFAAPR